MKDMYRGKVNSPITTLAIELGADDVVIFVEDITVLPEAPNIAVIGFDTTNPETIYYGEVVGNELRQVTREFDKEGSIGAKKAWAVGATIARLFTRYDHDTFINNIENVPEEITTTASSATPAPTGGSLRNLFTVTALEEGATFAAPSGTAANGNRLVIRIKDNGTARSLAWNAIYRAMEFALPDTTVVDKTMYLGFIYNSADSKWDMVAINEEA